MKRSWILSALTALLLTAAAQAEILLVHLPSAPIENASRLAGAVTDLARLLSAEIPGLDFEVEIYRRLGDAEASLGARGDSVVMLLSEASLVLDLPQGSGIAPVYQFQRAGAGTYRRILVIKASRPETRLSELRGASLDLVEISRGGAAEFLRLAAFDGEVDLASWFGRINLVSDDFLATADVLYDKVDAALPTENNPMVQAQLGKELRAIYTTRPLPLPVISLRTTAWSADRRAALTRTLAGLSASEAGRKVLEELRFDAVAPLTAEARAALSSLPALAAKNPEIALPDAASARRIAVALPSSYKLPEPSDLRWTIDLDLPEIAVDSTDLQQENE